MLLQVPLYVFVHYDSFPTPNIYPRMKFATGLAGVPNDFTSRSGVAKKVVGPSNVLIRVGAPSTKFIFVVS